jgi:hypothetical protein
MDRKSGQAAQAKTRPASRPHNPYGTDRALKLGAGKTALAISWWDLWYCVGAHERFADDLDALGRELKSQRQKSFLSRDWYRGALSHLRDLQRRLGTVTPAAVVAAAARLKVTARAAWGKVVEGKCRRSELSAAMLEPPDERGFAFALRGLWPKFPVSPAAYDGEIGQSIRKKGFYTEGQSFGLARRLDRYAAKAQKLADKRHVAEALALLRALLIGTIEVLGYADDSCGTIGDSFQQAFQEYLRLQLDQAGIPQDVFLDDLLTLLIWEDYGLTSRQADGFFRRLGKEASQRGIDFLRRQIHELLREDLDYQAEKALTLLGQVAEETRRFEMFEPLAAEMGSTHWERVLRLADCAVRARKRDLALKVLEASLKPGCHFELLEKHYRQLQRGLWQPEQIPSWAARKRLAR